MPSAEAGLLTFPALMVIPLLFGAESNKMRIPIALLVLLYRVCYALAGLIARRRSHSNAENATMSVADDWWSFGKLLAAMVLFLAVEGIFFRST